jgi:3-oxoacyl-[acyl-carrier protein] reductase
MSNSPAAIVTGASRGIGRAIAIELGRRGYSVIVNYHSNAQAAAAVVEAISAEGGAAWPVAADVGCAADREQLVNAAWEQFGRLDVLVNNAGITSPGRKDLLDATEESWDQVLDTNLKGPFFLAQLAARKMLELRQAGQLERGTLINISSISAYAVSTNRADYCIAKAGMEMMTWLYADRLATENIRVYEICPGIIASDMTAPVREKYDQQIAAGLTPIRRWGEPEDVAKAVGTLVTEAFAFSTGERFNVDGGFHIRRL